MKQKQQRPCEASTRLDQLEWNLYYTTPRYEPFDNNCTKCTQYTKNTELNGIDHMENMWRTGEILVQNVKTPFDCLIECGCLAMNGENYHVAIVVFLLDLGETNHVYNSS